MVLGFVLMSVVWFVLLNVVRFFSLCRFCVVMWFCGCVGCYDFFLICDVYI